MSSLEQAFNEAGVAFEPFHLKREREEGYFDSDGNYIQYKLDEVKDAWLDSLADGIFLALSSASCFQLCIGACFRNNFQMARFVPIVCLS